MRTIKGHIIALAYPDVFVRQTIGKYNYALSKIGIVNAGAVCAGHAALVLVNGESGELYYADFGRYITAIGYGRARTALTDPEVKINFKAEFNRYGEIINLHEIIKYMGSQNEITHGYGRLCVGLFRNISFDKALKYINRKSLNGSVPYGPWESKGTNCSRFVCSAIWKSSKNPLYRFKMVAKIFPTPMPLDVVMSAKKGDTYICINNDVKRFSISQWKTWMHLWRVPEVKLSMADSKEWQCPGGTWLGGVGDGSWFSLKPNDQNGIYSISRYDAHGDLIFEFNFIPSDDFNHEIKFEFTYDCNARLITIIQGGKQIKFIRTEELDSDFINWPDLALISS